MDTACTPHAPIGFDTWLNHTPLNSYKRAASLSLSTILPEHLLKTLHLKGRYKLDLYSRTTPRMTTPTEGPDPSPMLHHGYTSPGPSRRRVLYIPHEYPPTPLEQKTPK